MERLGPVSTHTYQIYGFLIQIDVVANDDISVEQVGYYDSLRSFIVLNRLLSKPGLRG